MKDFFSNLRQKFALKKWAKVALAVLSVVAILGLCVAFVLQIYTKDKIFEASLKFHELEAYITKNLPKNKFGKTQFSYKVKADFTSFEPLLRSRTISSVKIAQISWQGLINSDEITHIKAQNRYISFITTQNLHEDERVKNAKTLGNLRFQTDFSPLFASILKYYFCGAFIVILLSNLWILKSAKMQKFAIFLGLFAIILSLIFQSSLHFFSPHYTIYTDSSVFQYVANAILRGEMPYKDAIDHKGALLYLLNAAGNLIAPLRGVWILECLAVIFSVIFAYKTARIFLSRLAAFCAVMISFLAYFGCIEGGNLTEQYALPFLFISLWIFVRYFRGIYAKIHQNLALKSENSGTISSNLTLKSENSSDFSSNLTLKSEISQNLENQSQISAKFSSQNDKISPNLTPKFSQILSKFSLNFKSQNLPNFAKFDFALCGFCFGAVCLLRVNMIALWAVFVAVIFFAELAQKRLDFAKFFALGFLIITLPIIVWLWLGGALGEFWRWYILFNLNYGTNGAFSSRFEVFVKFALNPLMCLSIAFVVLKFAWRRDKFDGIFLSFILLDILAVCMSGRGYGHYFLVFCVIYLYGSIVFLELLKEFGTIKFTQIAVLTLFLGLLFLSPYAQNFKNAINFITKSEFLPPLKVQPNYENLALLIEKHSAKDDKISVFWNEAVIYLLANRLSASKYIYQAPLLDIDEDFFKDYLRDLRQNLPKIVYISEYADKKRVEDLGLKGLGYKEIEPNFWLRVKN